MPATVDRRRDTAASATVMPPQARTRHARFNASDTTTTGCGCRAEAGASSRRLLQVAASMKTIAPIVVIISMTSVRLIGVARGSGRDISKSTNFVSISAAGSDPRPIAVATRKS